MTTTQPNAPAAGLFTLGDLKPLLPSKAGNWRQQAFGVKNTEDDGVAGTWVSGDYSAGKKKAKLTITDLGDVARTQTPWTGPPVESGGTKTYGESGRTVREEDKRGGKREVTIVLGNGLAIGASGSNVEMAELKQLATGVDLSRATLWAVRARGSLAHLERLGVDALVDGDTALVAMRGDDDPWALTRDLVRRGAGAIGIDSRGGEPWQVRDALAGAQRACLVAAATGTSVRHGSELGALGGVARDVLAGDRVEPRFSDSEAHLVESLVATGWSKSAAARRMRISRQRLYERLAALAARHRLDPDLPQTRVELSLEIWALSMAELAHG